jgi:uncharacterized phage protein (TIGR01671 family)
MREILFRGKAINRDKGFHRTSYKNGEWVYGIISRLYDERFKNLPAEMTNTNGVGGIEVDYKTISQFIGLTDKNGKKIFEGDIVKLFLIDGEEIGVIKFNDILCRFCLYEKDGVYGFDKDCEFEIIGNIHDNPELLKGGAEK